MKKTIGMLMTLFSVNVSANYSCEGRVEYFGVDSGLHVSVGYGIHRLCLLNDESQSKKCSAWLSMAMSAQAQGKNLVVYYTDTTGKISSSETCSSVGNWVTPSDTVYFLRIK